MPDSNDIVFNQYSVDFFAYLRAFLEYFLGGGAGDGAGSSASGTAGGAISSFSVDSIMNTILNAWTAFTIISWTISILLIFGIIYAYLKAEQLSAVRSEILARQEKLYDELNGKKADNQRWLDVQEHIASDYPNSWRLAIIEADIILEEALEKAGFAGTTIGDKLKSASPASFSNLDQAWRAHKVRNEVAHSGSDFVLTKKMATETITQYKMALTELGAI